MTALDQAPLHATMIRAADLVASPWKNGGGVTREIGAFPPGAALDAFAWRVSVADVGTAGPFSRFDGIDRTLVLLSGAGMTLAEAGGPRHVLDAPLARADFAGETAIDATLHDGATRDFNLMTRRSAARGTLDVWRAGLTALRRPIPCCCFARPVRWASTSTARTTRWKTWTRCGSTGRGVRLTSS